MGRREQRGLGHQHIERQLPAVRTGTGPGREPVLERLWRPAVSRSRALSSAI